MDSAEEALSVCIRWSYLAISSRPPSCLVWACRTYRLPCTAVRGWPIEKRGRGVSGCRGKSSRIGRLHIRERNVEDGKDWQENHLCGGFWGWTGRIAVLLTPQTQKAITLFWHFILVYLQYCGCDVLGTVQTHLQPRSQSQNAAAQVFHFQNESCREVAEEAGLALQAGKLQHGNKMVCPRPWKESVSYLGIRARTFCQNQIYVSIPLIYIGKWV